jgi:hypothetical protein
MQQQLSSLQQALAKWGVLILAQYAEHAQITILHMQKGSNIIHSLHIIMHITQITILHMQKGSNIILSSLHIIIHFKLHIHTILQILHMEKGCR